MTTVRGATGTDLAQADTLRRAMVDELRRMGAIASDQVAEAVSIVPRHVFAPEVSLEQAYAANKGLVTKRDELGNSLSSVSAAHIQVTMLEQASIEPGMRVLEVGSGGYNAALMAELVGETGHVVSIDIDNDIVERARKYLDAAGYDQVVVLAADAENGVPSYAPFDRVIVTAAAWDVPAAWWQQLAERGRLVVPLRVRGLTRTVVLEHEDGRLVSRGYRLCGFVPMQGVGAHVPRVVELDGSDVTLSVDEEQALDSDRLPDAVILPRTERWSGVEFGEVDELDLWIATTTPVSAMFTAEQGAVERGVAAPSARWGVPVVVDDDSFAYRTKRPVAGTERFETGVVAHGPRAEVLADHVVGQLRTWDSTHRGRPGARFEIYPAGTPVALPDCGCVVDKKHTRVVISWPHTGEVS